MENVTENWGVFFDDSGKTYLVGIGRDETEAYDVARGLDREAFEGAVEKHHDEPDEYEEPDLEDFDGMHYIEEIDEELAEAAVPQLERGFAVTVVG